jgi:hypothetical protein
MTARGASKQRVAAARAFVGRRTRGAIYLALAFAAFAVTACEGFVPSAYAKDDGYFYRMTAKFEVKETGERIEFDFVAACGVTAPRWKEPQRLEGHRITPHAMVKATADGHAVVVETLEECSGFTSENGDVPPDVLPMAIWFDNVDDLSNGLGYVSEDAYDNPLSKLRFHGARIDPGTRADWEAWRKKAADEYVDRAAWWGPWGYDFPGNRGEEIGKYASACSGYYRIKLPDIIREKVRPIWPAERPRFWAPPDKGDPKISGMLSDATPASPSGGGPWVQRFGSPGTGYGAETSGMPIRSGRRVGKDRPAGRWPAEYYPFIMPPLTSAYPLIAAPRLARAEIHVQKLEYRNGTLNGFAACQNRDDIVGIARDDVAPAPMARRHVFVVDDQVVRDLESDMAGAASISAGDVLMLKAPFIFERDEYVFIRFKADL